VTELDNDVPIWARTRPDTTELRELSAIVIRKNSDCKNNWKGMSKPHFRHQLRPGQAKNQILAQLPPHPHTHSLVHCHAIERHDIRVRNIPLFELADRILNLVALQLSFGFIPSVE
jgi:hypothetical protein